MAANPALTSDEITALAGPTTAKWHLSVVNSTRTTLARINQASYAYPLAQLTVDGTDADWLSQKTGMRVDIGSTSGARDKGSYYIRQPAGLTTMYIGETSEGDPGLITQSIRSASFADDDYITIYLDELNLASVAPRFASGQIYENYDKAVSYNTTYPEPIVNIDINGNGRWAGMVDAGQTYRTIVLTASVGPTSAGWPTSSSVAYHYVLPSSWTVTAGDIHTNTVTCQVPASSQNYTFHCDVTEDHDSVGVAYRNVWSHDRSTNAPLPVANIDSVMWDRTTMKAAITLNDNVLASLRPGAMVNLWYEGTWGGADVPTAPTQFVGWVVSQGEHTEAGLCSAQINIEGVCGIMGRVGAYSDYFFSADDPATWQQIVPSLSYVDFWMWFIVRWRAGNIVKLFNWTPLGISNLTGRLPQAKIPVAGSLLEQVRGLAQSYTANVGSNPDGEIMIRLHPNLQVSRTSIVNRATLSASIYTSADMTRTFIPTVRKVRGEGLYWDGSAIVPTPYLADAPGDAPGQGTREERLAGQFVDSQADLNNRTALYYMMLNNPLAEITPQILKNYAIFYPAEMQFAIFTDPANLHPSGVAINMKTIPQSCTLKWNSDTQTLDFEMTAEGETNTNVAALTVPIPSPIVSTPPITITTTSSSPYQQHDGTSVIAHDDAHIGLGSAFTTSSAWTPGPTSGLTGTLMDLQLDPFAPFLVSKSGVLPAYMLTTDGLWYISNIFNVSATWTHMQSMSIADSFGIPGGHIRPSTNINGDIYVGAYASGVAVAQRLNGNGATSVWRRTDSRHPDNAATLDIDHYGSDEMLWGIRVGAGGDNPDGQILRIINGGSPTTLVSGLYKITLFIQKPLKTFSGANNSSVSSSECFIHFNSTNDSSTNLQLYRTPDGGATHTNITPSSGVVAVLNPSSLIFTTNSNIITCPFTVSGVTKIYRSSDAGDSWAAGATDSSALTSMTFGYYPQTVAGQYAIYTGGSGGMGYSPDQGATLNDATGDWTSSIGAISGKFRSVIPLY